MRRKLDSPAKPAQRTRVVDGVETGRLPVTNKRLFGAAPLKLPPSRLRASVVESPNVGITSGLPVIRPEPGLDHPVCERNGDISPGDVVSSVFNFDFDCSLLVMASILTKGTSSGASARPL